VNMHLEYLKPIEPKRCNLVETKVHCFQVVVEVAYFPHTKILQVESYIQIHRQQQECEWLRLLEEDLKERLGSHLLMPCVEIVGEGGYALTKEKDPKVCWYYQTEYMVIEKI